MKIKSIVLHIWGVASHPRDPHMRKQGEALLEVQTYDKSNFH